MIFVHCMNRSDYEAVKNHSVYGEELLKKDGCIHCSTWNSFFSVAPLFMKNSLEKVLLCMDSKRLTCDWKWEDNDHDGLYYPHLYGCLNMDSVIEVVPFVYKNGIWKRKECTHILMNNCQVDEEWCYPMLSQYIRNTDHVCVVAFSFWENTKTLDDWNKQYRKSDGLWYHANTDVWKRYGILENAVEWINYFSDTPTSARNKIMNSSVVLFTGGAPDLMMNRIKEFQLQDVFEHYQGVMIGYSAGAMIQLQDYHISPDDDYAHFSYETGLSILKNFDIEVHYEASDVQQQCIHKVIEDKMVDVYAIYEDGGLLVDAQGIHPFGEVDRRGK